MKNIFVPFCGITWCGFDAENIHQLSLSIWFCMSSSCTSNLIALIAICGVLALFTFITSATVLLVFLLNEKLQNSQGIYKISFAISDIMVGAVVIPSFAITLVLFTIRDEKMGDVYPDTPYNSSISERYDSVPRLPGGYLDEKLTASYRNGIGFFTFISLTVSVYTLLLAGFDRLAVVRKPLRYSRDTAKKNAIKAVVVMWLIAVVLSCLPYFVNGMEYGLLASALIAVYGQSSLYVYTVVFALPLLTIWITSI
uniref:G-protein coupled receptors family 1 profile domain-containing protein n=1 Tax=Ciona savignyi TaxID=51511 RepID=H2ZK72_CIOSA